MSTDHYDHLKRLWKESQKQFTEYTYLFFGSTAVALLTALGVLPLPFPVAVIGLGFSVVWVVVLIAIIYHQEQLLSAIFTEERKVYHIHASDCETQDDISVVEEKFIYQTVGTGSHWTGPMSVKKCIFERTKCNHCGTEMIWEEGKERYPV